MFRNKTRTYFPYLGIRIVKYYAWEDAFSNNIDKFRESELGGVKKISTLRATIIALLQSTIIASLGLTIVRADIKS